MMNEKLLKEKAKHYLVCYYEPCQKREHCLRWLVGPHVPETELVKECVNVTNAEVRAGRCSFYKPDTPLKMARGMTLFYEEMPRRIAVSIKQKLETDFGHTAYYNFRNGKQPITPEKQQHIANVCREHGWTEPPVYDAMTEEYDW